MRVAEGLASMAGDPDEVERLRGLATRLTEPSLAGERSGAV